MKNTMMYEEELKIQADVFVNENLTIRRLAKKFCISKTAMHLRLTQKLMEIDYERYQKVRILLDKNKAERHYRGGQATKRKYLSK